MPVNLLTTLEYNRSIKLNRWKWDINLKKWENKQIIFKIFTHSEKLTTETSELLIQCQSEPVEGWRLWKWQSYFDKFH